MNRLKIWALAPEAIFVHRQDRRPNPGELQRLKPFLRTKLNGRAEARPSKSNHSSARIGAIRRATEFFPFAISTTPTGARRWLPRWPGLSPLRRASDI